MTNFIYLVIPLGLPTSIRAFWIWIQSPARYSQWPNTFRRVLFMHQSSPLYSLHYTGPIVLSTDTNAYLAVSFICNSAWVMTMKSYDGWQSFEPVFQNSQKVNNIVIKRALQEKCCIVLFIFSFSHWLTSSFHPLFSNRLCNCSYSLVYVPRVQAC